MDVKDIFNAVENIADMVPGVSQITGVIKLVDQTYELVSTLIKDSQDVLEPGDLATVHEALTSAIANRKAQQAVTDVALAQASAVGAMSLADQMALNGEEVAEVEQPQPVIDMTAQTNQTNSTPANTKPAANTPAAHSTGTAGTVNSDKNQK